MPATPPPSPICNSPFCDRHATWHYFSIEDGQLTAWTCLEHTFDDNQDAYRLVHIKDALEVAELHQSA